MVTCQGCGEETSARLCCPKCTDLGRSCFFCTQECFTASWSSHSKLHMIIEQNVSVDKAHMRGRSNDNAIHESSNTLSNKEDFADSDGDLESNIQKRGVQGRHRLNCKTNDISNSENGDCSGVTSAENKQCLPTVPGRKKWMAEPTLSVGIRNPGSYILNRENHNGGWSADVMSNTAADAAAGLGGWIKNIIKKRFPESVELRECSNTKGNKSYNVINNAINEKCDNSLGVRPVASSRLWVSRVFRTLILIFSIIFLMYIFGLVKFSNRIVNELQNDNVGSESLQLDTEVRLRRVEERIQDIIKQFEILSVDVKRNAAFWDAVSGLNNDKDEPGRLQRSSGIMGASVSGQMAATDDAPPLHSAVKLKEILEWAQKDRIHVDKSFVGDGKGNLATKTYGASVAVEPSMTGKSIRTESLDNLNENPTVDSDVDSATSSVVDKGVEQININNVENESVIIEAKSSISDDMKESTGSYLNKESRFGEGNDEVNTVTDFELPEIKNDLQQIKRGKRAGTSRDSMKP